VLRPTDFSIAGSVTLPTGVVLTSSNYYYIDITLPAPPTGPIDSTNPVVDGSFSSPRSSPGTTSSRRAVRTSGFGEVAVQVT